jgi:hypothetical protein
MQVIKATVILNYGFIARKKKTYPIDRMCQSLEVKRSVYYRWAKQKKDYVYLLHSEMLDWVKKIVKGA